MLLFCKNQPRIDFEIQLTTRFFMYESLFKHVLFPFYETVVKRRSTCRDLADYEASQYLAPQALAALQLQKLNTLLDNAWREVPFLQTYWHDHGVKPGALGDAAELAAYPVLTKELITEHYEDMIATPWRGRTLSKTTGGSTGKPFKLAYTQASYAARTALMWRGYRWGGANLGRRTVYLWGMPLGSSNRKLEAFHTLYNRRMLNSFSLRTDNAADYVRAINQFKPLTIVGYVAPLVTLAQWILKTGTRVYAPTGVLTGAEALQEPQRQLIEAAFQAPAFNTYGSREFGLIAAECSAKSGLHVSAEHLVAETVNDLNEPVFGQVGHLLITDLTNHAMPFVRYRIGDAATLTPQRCGCGRNLPLFSAVHGRTLDLIRTRDGRLLPGEYFPMLFNEFAFIKQYQIVQHDLDHVDVNLVAQASDAAPHLSHFEHELRKALGPSVQTRINFMDELPLTSSGKLRVTISHVCGLPD
jgi:phenylacetate-CoA ligase